MNYDEEDAPDTQDGFEESRQLTHEEIWDDSALVDAWNAANEEYEALNGPDKSWKKDPVFKSPLWYNTPAIQKTPQAGPSSPNKRTKTKTAPADDSQPLNFENFVPNHDPSLAANGAGPTYASPGIVGQDEAFTRAVEASYWSGYWTAVYHYHRHMPTGRNTEGEDEQEEVTAEVEDGMVAEEDGDDMISTQR
ncbi:hypothetical protein GLOTRDRAFT_109348 [Gloeophyllum trabeum ATCC 11539]|uniref:Survival motor neuron Tudor domain-containing protein n=1 Tax=Gloeophyllum trabeum (strain ATCC 11539 / FP-39264 / Madison 617) TaxID=670483 RepID=S7S186_GLOTA|nr:uncharacterized protein GLOTRDRAFT_109348 [Gloeophyllum trabeum ATCC 11539]EPQ61190.1 hypothetical protein GLOTRDRAFT_109348 [Gloeophyllum trabeum ATCC 11539]